MLGARCVVRGVGNTMTGDDNAVKRNRQIFDESVNLGDWVSGLGRDPLESAEIFFEQSDDVL